MEMRQQDAGLRRPDPWAIVKTWPTPSRGRSGLDDLPKLVWREMYDVAGGIDRKLSVHCNALAAALGKNDTRGIRNALASLKEVGLISSPDKGYDGDRLIHLHNPSEARRAWERKMRLVSAANSGQRELEFAEEPESPPLGRGETPPEVLRLPGANATAPAKEAGAQLHAHETPRLSKAAWDGMSPADRDGWVRMELESRRIGAAEQAHHELPTVGQIAGAVVGRERQTIVQDVRQVDELASLIAKRLADAHFFPGFYKRIAWAVVNREGGLEFNVIEKILDRLDAKCRRETGVNRGSYFYRSVQAEFSQRYLTLSDRQQTRRK